MSALLRIATIASNTMREAVRNKLLYALLLFATGLILSGMLLASLSYVENERILQDVGMGAIRLLGVAIAVFVGVGLIHQEVERRTIFTILSKPITRGEFLLGKFAGLVATVWLQLVLMVAIFALVSRAGGAPLTVGHAQAFLLTGVELAVMVAVATFFSAFTTPILASFFSCGLWLVGNLTRNLRDLGAQSDLESVREVTLWLHRLMPDLEAFNLSVKATHGLAVAHSDVWLALVYGAGYTAIVLTAAVTVFARRDFR